MDTLRDVDQPVTGLDLKLRRTEKRIKQIRLAEAMGVRPQYLSQVEARAVVPADTADRYLAALAAVANARSAA